MKKLWSIIVISLAFGLSVWIADALADYLVFYRGDPFFQLLITRPPAHEIYIRLLIVILFLSFGLLSARRLRREEAISRNLRDAVDGRETLLREVHHRVKNNLMVISGIIKLKMVQHPGEAESLAEIRDRVNTIALIHKHLYQGERLAEVHLDHYLREMALEVHHLHFSDSERIELHLDLKPVISSQDVAVPCGLIVHELLHNACDHAFRDGQAGTVSLSLASSDNTVTIVIRDDGIGMDTDANRRTNETLGLSLVEALAGQLHGTITITGSDGVHAELVFPLGGGRSES